MLKVTRQPPWDWFIQQFWNYILLKPGSLPEVLFLGETWLSSAGMVDVRNSRCSFYLTTGYLPQKKTPPK